MLGRLRRRLARTRARTGESLRYWWLEQTDWGQSRGPGWRRLLTRVRRGWRPVVLATAVVVVVGGAVVAGQRAVDERATGEQDQPRTGRGDGVAVAGAQRRSRGPGLTGAGIHLRVSPEGSGELRVRERIVAPEPVRVLRLDAPPSITDAAAGLVDLQVTADGSAVTVDGSGEAVQRRALRLPRPATTIELRYRVVDADERSASAPPGRATLSLRPAASDAVGTSPAVVEVRGAVVHALVCVDAPLEQQLCGVDDRRSWHTEPLPAASASVLALVDLPQP